MSLGAGITVTMRSLGGLTVGPVVFLETSSSVDRFLSPTTLEYWLFGEDIFRALISGCKSVPYSRFSYDVDGMIWIFFYFVPEVGNVDPDVMCIFLVIGSAYRA